MTTPFISFITTCKNRLHHLRQTLPLMMRQSYAEVIVVDYGCQQGTSDWVKENFPSAIVIKQHENLEFCVSRARNFGAERAGGEWLCFIDADIMLNIDLGIWIAGHAKEFHYYLATESAGPSAFGTVICSKKDFVGIGGYDEAFIGGGGEDADLYGRFDRASLSRGYFPENSLFAIQHGDDERQLNEGVEMASKAIAMQVIRLYLVIKPDIEKIIGQAMDISTRCELMKQIKKQVNNYAYEEGLKEHHIKVVINQGLHPVRHVNLERQLVYILKPSHNRFSR